MGRGHEPLDHQSLRRVRLTRDSCLTHTVSLLAFQPSIQQFRLQPRIPLLAGPKREGDCRQIIDERGSVSVFRQIDRREKKLAGITGFHANVRQLLCYVHRQLGFGLFAARGAQDAPKLPLLRTKRAQQKPFPAIAFRPERSQEWTRTAQGANSHGHNNGSPRRQSRAKFGIRLQECSSQELCES